MTTAEFASGLKPVTLSCFEVFSPYYAERAKHYVYPSYMQSVCYMVSKGNFFYKEFSLASGGKVLLAVSHSLLYGIFGVQVNVAPISLTGSLADEMFVLRECLKQGLSVKLTAEDIKRYHIPARLYGVIGSADEYIYHSQHGTAMCGSKYRKLRNQTKRVINAEGYRLIMGATEEAAAVVSAWDERYKRMHGSPTHQTTLWNVCKSAPHGYVSIRNIFIGDTMQCVSVLERLSAKQYVIVLRVRKYDSGIHDVGAAMQYVDCSAVSDGQGANPIYLNIGMADTEGLTHAKKALLPCCQQKIYKARATKLNQLLKTYFR